MAALAMLSAAHPSAALLHRPNLIRPIAPVEGRLWRPRVWWVTMPSRKCKSERRYSALPTPGDQKAWPTPRWTHKPGPEHHRQQRRCAFLGAGRLGGAERKDVACAGGRRAGRARVAEGNDLGLFGEACPRDGETA